MEKRLKATNSLIPPGTCPVLLVTHPFLFKRMHQTKLPAEFSVRPRFPWIRYSPRLQKAKEIFGGNCGIHFTSFFSFLDDSCCSQRSFLSHCKQDWRQEVFISSSLAGCRGSSPAQLTPPAWVFDCWQDLNGWFLCRYLEITAILDHCTILKHCSL